ncbi:MAG: chemotaxis-specific protein-glutamate methyltransferase CheB [Planctomycetota bacterium]
MKPRLPISVLVVDNSPVVRTTLRRVLNEASDINVVACAKDAFEARGFIIEHKPGVIVLSRDLPRIDGLAFLRKLMAHYPVPVIMCCPPRAPRDQTAMKAIELGATDVVMKPSVNLPQDLRCLGLDLVDKIRAAAQAIRRPPAIPPNVIIEPIPYSQLGIDPARYLVAVGASTGGTEAIKTMLALLPADFPPVAIVQHMPEAFTGAFAARLDQSSRVRVTEALDGDVLLPGRAFLARGGIQMSVAAGSGGYRIKLGTRELVNRHCPSVDVLFDSVAEAAGEHAAGILLTGMGADGARGLLKMRQAGAITIAQDRRTSVVYGMPKVAAEIGAAQLVQPLAQIPLAVARAFRQRSRTAASCANAQIS